MIKYVIVDTRKIEKLSQIISGALQQFNIEYAKDLLPVFLNKSFLTEQGVDAIWDILADRVSKQKYYHLDYDMVNHIFEDIALLISHELNILFNIQDNTYYYFENWIGDDLKLEIGYE